MPENLALPAIFDSVVARFVADGVTANVVFGKREPAKHTNMGPGTANRVVFSPGKGNKAGRFTPPRDPGRNPRSLFSFREWCDVYVWAVDNSAGKLNDERAQYRAARLLADQVVRAIYLAMHGTALGAIEISDPEWVRENIERSYGAELKFTLEVPGLVPDVVDPEVVATQAANAVGFDPTGTGIVTVTENEVVTP